MVLQQLVDDLDSSGMLVGRCLKYLWAKRTMEFDDGLQNAELTCFARKWGFCALGVLRGKGVVFLAC